MSIGRWKGDVLDFRAFIGLGVIAVEYYGADSYCALLAAVLVRDKLETILCRHSSIRKTFRTALAITI